MRKAIVPNDSLSLPFDSRQFTVVVCTLDSDLDWSRFLALCVYIFSGRGGRDFGVPFFLLGACM